MGRTNPTFRNLLTGVEQRWGDYRRALRRRDKPHFDSLFGAAEAHADAAGYLDADDPMAPILFSMLLEHQRQVVALQERVDELEARVRAAEEEPGKRAGGEDSEGANEEGGEGVADGDERSPTPESSECSGDERSPTEDSGASDGDPAAAGQS